jgi:hypothetical protein
MMFLKGVVRGMVLGTFALSMWLMLFGCMPSQWGIMGGITGGEGDGEMWHRSISTDDEGWFFGGLVLFDLPDFAGPIHPGTPHIGDRR